MYVGQPETRHSGQTELVDRVDKYDGNVDRCSIGVAVSLDRKDEECDGEK